MVYKCSNCGEEEDFYAHQSYTEYGTRKVYLDGNGEEVDVGDYDSGETDTGVYEDVMCSNCHTAVVWEEKKFKTWKEKLEVKK